MKSIQPAGNAWLRQLSLLLDRLLASRWTVPALLVLGAILRFGSLLRDGDLDPSQVESQRIAVALATKGEFADAYGPGSGPTAHVTPAVVVFPALVYKLTGVETVTSEFILSAISILFVLASFWLVYRCFQELRSPALACLAGLAVVCLFPFQIRLEAYEMKVWEAGQGAAMLAAMLLVVLKLDRDGEIGWRHLIALAFAAAFIAFVSPAAGLASAGVVGVLLLRRVTFWKWPLVAMLTLAFFLALNLPWMLRNERVFGERIWTRSSFGLGLGISNYEGVLDMPSRRDANVLRFQQVHPHYKDGKARARMEAMGGELPYYHAVQREAEDWIRTHPEEAATVWAQNWREYYFPPQWFWERWQGETRWENHARHVVLSLLSLIAFLTLAAMLARRNGRYLYVAAPVILAALPYVIVYPLLRYRYIISSILIFLAIDGMIRLFRWWKGRRAATA